MYTRDVLDLMNYEWFYLSGASGKTKSTGSKSTRKMQEVLWTRQVV